MRNMVTTVYYFCEKKFKGAGFTWFYETQCLRIPEGDTRIPELYKKYNSLGFIHQVKYSATNSPKPYDIDWETKQVETMNYATSKMMPGTHRHNIVIVKEGTSELK